jgi:hypothetical protein
MTASITLRQALLDPDLLGTVLAGDSFRLWRIVLIATMGESLEPDEIELFRSVTGGREPPTQRVDEAAYVVGRRGGKDKAASAAAAYLATLVDYTPVLSTGEIPTLLCLAPDQRQARITKSYIRGALDSSPMLSGLVKNETADAIELANGVVVEVRAASFRRLRGVTAIGVIASECAFWYDESATGNSDSEILNAVRPTLATTGGPLIMISSPYRKSGELWETFKQFGPDGDPHILVAHGASRTFNPTLPQRVIDRAMQRDEAAARAEYGAEFRSDISDFVSRDAVQACVDAGVRERPPQPNITYAAGVDSSGGTHDSAALAIGHVENGVVVVDALREIPAPHDPESAADEMCRLLATYRVHRVTGDRYAGRWTAQAFEKRGVEYQHSDLSKSQAYSDALPRINAKTIRLLDLDRCVNQLCALERRTTRGGRDSIDHPANGSDDVANAVAMLAAQFNVTAVQGGAWIPGWGGRMRFVPINECHGF